MTGWKQRVGIKVEKNDRMETTSADESRINDGVETTSADESRKK
jgi:hypothetical protein